MDNETINVLLIEDSLGDARLIREYLSETQTAKFTVVHAERLSNGLELYSENNIDVILLDLGLPDSRGLDTFAKLHAGARDTPIVVLTGLDDEKLGEQAVQAGAQDYLTKAQVTDVLLSRAIRYAIERKQTEKDLKDYSDRLEILRHVHQAILVAQSSKAIAEAALAHMRRSMPCHQACLMLFDFETHEAVVLRTDSEFETKYKAGTRMSLKTFPSLDHLKDGLVYGVRDIKSLSELSPLESDLLDEAVSSYVLVPLIVQGELIGAIILAGDNPEICSSEQVEIALEVANSLGVALGQVRLLDQIRAGRNQLQALTRRLVELQEAERRHIARELHDEIGQLLTGLKILLELGTRLPADKVKHNMESAQLLVNDLISRMQDLSLNLRPAMLDDLGLLPALLWQFKRYTKQTGIQVESKHSGLDENQLPPEVETAAYRIVQESLTNVARYAGVEEVDVRLWVDEDILNLQVEDKGVGFNPSQAMEEYSSSGLIGMRERALSLGGWLTVESELGSGTRLTAALPIRGQF
jgi:signal transduction histidine kinase